MPSKNATGYLLLVRRGRDWVLRSGDDVYRLKNQAGTEDFAGEKV